MNCAAIYIVDRLYTRASNWWPLIPAGVALLLAAFMSLSTYGVGLTAQQWEQVGRFFNKTSRPPAWTPRPAGRCGSSSGRCGTRARRSS